MTLCRLNSVFISIVLLLVMFVSCENNKGSQNNKQFDQKIYDETADAKAEIAKAISMAQQGNKHILLMFGGNWCVWCHRLHRLFRDNPTIKSFLNENYILVMIDVGKRDKNLDLNEKYGNPFQHGFPVLVVLDKDGTALHTQETGSLEYTPAESTEKGHHPERVLRFLRNWAPKKL